MPLLDIGDRTPDTSAGKHVLRRRSPPSVDDADAPRGDRPLTVAGVAGVEGTDPSVGAAALACVREAPQMAEQRVVADGVFTWPSESPQLIGARCTGCGVVTFPRQGSCPRCTGQDLVEHLLPRTGTLWSWTIQGFLPKNPPYIGTETPSTFKPYGVGYVQLADEVIVESRLTTADPAELAIGRDMHLVIEAFTTDSEGCDVLTFAFAPGASV